MSDAKVKAREVARGVCSVSRVIGAPRWTSSSWSRRRARASSRRLQLACLPPPWRIWSRPGATPYLSAPRLGELGFAVAIYPATAFLAATYAVSEAMEQLRSHGRLEDMSRIVTITRAGYGV
jgi:hypothetical protein